MKRFLSILLALMMIFSTVSFAAPSMVGTVETSSEVTDYEAKEVKAEVQSETATPIIDPKFGRLIARIDFDKDTLAVDTNLANKTDVNTMGYTDLDFEGAPEKITLYRSGTSLVVKQEEGGNKYGLFTIDGDNQFSKLGFSARKADGSISILPQGQYTIKANVTSLTINGSAVDESTDLISWTAVLNPARPTESYGENITEPGENNVFTLVANDVEANAAEGDFSEELCRSFPAYLKGQKITTSAYNNANAYLFNGVCNVAAYPDADKSYDLTYKVDDIELYYLAPVKVTFNNGGVEGAEFSGDSTEFYINNGASIKPSDYKYSNTSDKLFTGWKDQNGNTVWGTVNPTEDLVLTAQWIDAYSNDYGTLVATIDFEKYALGTTVKSYDCFDLSTIGTVTDNLPEGFPATIYFSHSGVSASIVGTTGFALNFLR